VSRIANLVVAKSGLQDFIDRLFGLSAIIKDTHHYLLRCRHT
jgi:hypothetical protein